MKPRTWLIILQVLGAASLFVYPGVLLASIMGLGSGGSATTFTDYLALAFYAMTLAYPFVWIILWFLSWQALKYGRVALAMILSTPPVLATAAFALLLTMSSFYAQQVTRSFDRAERQQADTIRQQSALAASVFSFDAGQLTWAELQRAIETAPAEELSRPVDIPDAQVDGMETTVFVEVKRRPRTPLAMLVFGSQLTSHFYTSEAKPHYVDAARLLIKRGATLSPAEIAEEPQLVWLAEALGKGIELPDRNAEKENPLVFSIMEAPMNDTSAVSNAIFSAAHNNPALLSRPTITYGSPLRAAIVRNFSNIVTDLLYNGAVLAPAERNIPSLNRTLTALLNAPGNADYKQKYEAALKAEPR